MTFQNQISGAGNQPYGSGPVQGYGQPQAAGPSFTLATFGQRVLGLFYDILLTLPFVLLMLVAIIPAVISDSGGAVVAAVLIFLVGWLSSMAFALYQLHLQGTTGSTIGKRWVGIAVVREQDARPTGFGMAFVRNLAHAVDSLVYIGYFWPLFDAKRQTFADKICSTVVIRTK